MHVVIVCNCCSEAAIQDIKIVLKICEVLAWTNSNQLNQFIDRSVEDSCEQGEGIWIAAFLILIIIIFIATVLKHVVNVD